MNEIEQKRWNDAQWTALWPRRERLTDAVSPLLLEAASLRAGERVLDVGCGGGKTSLAAARAVGPQGTATGADISAPLAALARQRAEEAGVDNVSFHVVD
ncbi:MAG: SAM-dependent methyltransferase, partial [Solirubrobacteraceae bacterium]